MTDPDSHSPRDSIDAWFGNFEPELRAMAGRLLARERRGHTLQPTALVNELYLKFANQNSLKARDETHFKAQASIAMWQILVDYARQRSAKKRQYDQMTTLTKSVTIGIDQTLIIDEAIVELHDSVRNGPRIIRQIWYRSMGGLKTSEISQLLDLSERQVRRDWIFAQAWLQECLAP